MSHTNIDLDRIEQALPGALANKRASIIQDALKRVNIWLSSELVVNNVVEILYYKEPDGGREKFPIDPVKQLLLLEHLFDKNLYLIYQRKTTQTITKSLFGAPKVSSTYSEDPQYLFTKLPNDLNYEISLIKDILMGLRNPRVNMTLEEHKTFVNLLKRFDLNLSDYYI